MVRFPSSSAEEILCVIIRQVILFSETIFRVSSSTFSAVPGSSAAVCLSLIHIFLSGVILTFIPSMGLFFIADILGGNKVVLVGSLIQDQLMKAHNWPFAAALSVALMIMTTLMIALYKRVTHSEELEGLL